MSAGKILNTSNPLYSNIVRALSADKYVQKLIALDAGSDTTTQPESFAVTDATTYTFTAQQGITRDATHWFGSSSSKIEKYDLINTLIAANNDPYASLPAGLDHIGDCCLHGDYLYAGASNWSGSSSTKTGIAIFNKLDLTYHDYIDLDALPDLEAAGVCVSKDGTELLICSFSQNAATPNANKYIHRVNLATKLYVGSYELSEQVFGMQGIDYSPDDNVYYISTHPTNYVGSNGRIVTVSTEFEVLSRHDPVSMSLELEGVCVYDGINYIHEINKSPRTFNTSNVFLSKNDGEAISVIDNSLITDSCTLLLNLKTLSLFNYNSVIDNTESDNSWESWITSVGDVFFRVNASTFVKYGSKINNKEDYILAYTWDNNSGTVTCNIGVNGVFGTPVSASWVSPPINGLWLGGANSSNDLGDFIYHDMILLNKVLSAPELLEASTNFNSFYEVGEKPQGTVTIDSVEETTNSAEIGFSYNSDDESGFKYRLNGGEPVDAGTQNPFIITGLSASTEYTIELAAYNNYGESDYSVLSTFSTLTETSILTITNSNTPDGTYSGKVYNDNDNTFIGSFDFVFSGGDCDLTLPIDASTNIHYIIPGDNPPVTGIANIGVTV